MQSHLNFTIVNRRQMARLETYAFADGKGKIFQTR
jgi:hypothetical protein